MRPAKSSPTAPGDPSPVQQAEGSLTGSVGTTGHTGGTPESAAALPPVTGSGLAAALVSVWDQVMAKGRSEVELDGRRFPLQRTRGKGLQLVAFTCQGVAVEGIEQNPATSSRWAKLAQEGTRIMQFSARGRYFANVCEGRVTRYPTWRSLGLPE